MYASALQGVREVPAEARERQERDKGMKEISENELEGQEMPGDGWFIIEAAGQHPARIDGQQFTQNLTAEVLAGVAAAGVPAEGLPIDRDHLSLDARNSTEALGWVRELAICGGNLAARIEWTTLGLPLIQGRIYKHFSTVYPPDAEQVASGVYTPTHLIGLALTNQPNNKEGQPPISNRGLAENQNKKTMDYPAELLAALGLAEGASDEEVMGAVNTLNKRVADAEAASAAAAADAEADKLVNQEEKETGAVLNEEERKEVKQQIVANREHGLKYMKLLCNSKRPQQVQTAPAEQPRRYADRSEVKPVANRMTDGEQSIANRAMEICAEARKVGRPIDYYTGLKRARSEAESANKNNN